MVHVTYFILFKIQAYPNIKNWLKAGKLAQLIELIKKKVLI